MVFVASSLPSASLRPPTPHNGDGSAIFALVRMAMNALSSFHNFSLTIPNHESVNWPLTFQRAKGWHGVVSGEHGNSLSSRFAGDKLFVALSQTRATSVSRYTFQYATIPSRFSSPIITPADKISKAPYPPPACPQLLGYGKGPLALEEQCLYLNVFVPEGSEQRGTLLYVHGGSFLWGSSTEDVEGEVLAARTGMNVVTVNYRLGLSGWMPIQRANGTGWDGNWGLRDVIAAIQFLQPILPSMNSSPDLLTLIGHSSGASLLRALLLVPPELLPRITYNRLILHSDPLNYGEKNQHLISQIGERVEELKGATQITTVDWLSELTMTELLLLQQNLTQMMPQNYTDITSSPLFGPMVDGEYIPFPSYERYHEKDILITTTRNEALPSISSTLSRRTVDLPHPHYEDVITHSVGLRRKDRILASGLYDPSPMAPLDVLEALEAMGTDMVWACPSLLVASRPQSRVYLAEFHSGLRHRMNTAFEDCGKEAVCHGDDISLLFDRGNESMALKEEVAARWKAFVMSGNPNVRGAFEGWRKGTIRVLGKDQEEVDTRERLRICRIWESEIGFDYQIWA
ncbi:alpha/beta-hydrolase [Atractiella rhizophila]|nr:alpha/beta-hydrolase [Atractiella rhizophila]